MISKKSIHIREFIEEQVALMGIDKFKHLFGVQESSINTWRRSDSMPRPAQVQKLVALSKGRLTMESVTRDHLKRKAEKAKKKR